MDALVRVLLNAAVYGVLAFVAGLLLKSKHGILGCVGAGFIGFGVGLWVGGLIDVRDPLTITLHHDSYPLLFGFGGTLLVLLVAKLIGGRR